MVKVFSTPGLIGTSKRITGLPFGARMPSSSVPAKLPVMSGWSMLIAKPPACATLTPFTYRPKASTYWLPTNSGNSSEPKVAKKLTELMFAVVWNVMSSWTTSKWS